MQTHRSFIIVMLLAIFLAACRSQPVVEPQVTEVDTGGAGMTDGSDVSVTELGGDGSLDDSGLGAGSLDGSGVDGGDGSIAGLSEEELLARRRVYFEFDSSTLDEESRAIVEAHSNYLVSNYTINIVLEGHADERGTREYNLALGERRAKAVSKLMQALGVDSSRIQTISFGEERPVALGLDEADLALNRRVEILYDN